MTAQSTQPALLLDAEDLPQGIARFDSTDRLVALNSAWRSLFPAVPRDGILGRPRGEVIETLAESLPTPRAKHAMRQAHAASQGAVAEWEWELSGDRWVSVTESALRDGGRLWVAVQASRYKLRERLLGESAKRHEQFAAIIAATDLGVCITDPTLPDMPIVYVNPAFLRMTGYGESEVLGRNCRFLSGPRSDRATLAKIRQAIEERRPETVTLVNYTKAGAPFWNELSLFPVFDERGTLSLYVSTQRDVTRLSEVERAAAQAWAQLEALLDHTPILLSSIGADDRIDVLEGQALQKLGIDAAAMRGQPSAALTSRLPGTAEALRKAREGQGSQLEVDAGAALLDINFVPFSSLGASDRNVVIVGMDVTERKRARSRIERLAFFDQPTGLPNRARLVEHAAQTLAGGRPLAIANLEIDRFMEVTTALGFEFSDALLLAASGRIKTAWPDSLVARIGNARIGVCLPDVSTQRELQAALAIIRVAFDEALLLDRRRLVLNIRLGGALAAPGTSAQQTMREAEIALHASAKNTERWSIFDEAMQQALVASQEIEHELRRLLVDGESSRRGGLSLAYQPIVTLADTGGRQLAGFEALLRWNHPKRGPISPTTFVPIAEATGLIHRIGGFVLSEAIEALARWRDAPSCRTDGLFMSVNVSLRQLATGDFPDQVATTLRQFDLDPRLLKLEITESTAMSDVDATLAQLDRLRGIGASLSIDDFGTGYSSLAYLHRLPVDTIKIDRAFVSEVHVRPTNAEIIKTITAMSRAIGFNVVAEGVECAEEESILRAAGCNFGQGYLYGRGVPEAEVLPLLAH